MPRVKSMPKRRRGGARTTVTGRRVLKRYGYKKLAIRRAPRTITTNTAAIKENYTVSIQDGNMTFFRNIQLADLSYDRAQSVAQAFQEFRIKYVKFTFQPSADTFPLAAGNTIPQMYFMIDRANAVPTNITIAQLRDMGAKVQRFDDKNKVIAFKPSVLMSGQSAPGADVASQIKLRPWLSTNANSGNIGAGWAPSAIDHQGLVMFITKVNPATPPVPVNVDVEVVFQFRKPLWRVPLGGVGASSYQVIEGGEAKIVTLDLSGNNAV